jgi:hypothetical protein
MIIFGSCTLPSARGKISGYCPDCRGPRVFQGFGRSTWFTLYFIPVFPIGSAGGYYQCTSCGSAFHSVAAEIPTAASVTSADVRRSLSLLLVSLDSTSERQATAVCTAFRNLTGESCTLQEVGRDVDEARLANADLAAFVNYRFGASTMEQKRALLDSAREVVFADGHGGAREHYVLAKFGAALEVPVATVNETIARGGAPR